MISDLNVHNLKKGQKIVYYFINNGIESDKKLAKEHLETNKEYTIDKFKVDRFHTRIWLEEINDISFNSVLFTEKENYDRFIQWEKENREV